MILQIEAFGETKSIREWTRDYRSATNLNYDTLFHRLRNGWVPEDAITKHKFKYQHNCDYFKEWTHVNAWIIGFITADGNVTTDASILSIKIATKDSVILYHIRDKVSPQNIIYTYLSNDGRNKEKRHCISALNICSGKIIKSLVQYNIIPQKTGKEKLPDFPNKEIAYRYLLGLIDGDGCIGYYKANGTRCVTLFSASINFLEQIKEYFGFDASIINGNHCYGLRIGQKQQLIYLYHNLYDSGGFCLQRKKDKFIEIINSYHKKEISYD